MNYRSGEFKGVSFGKKDFWSSYLNVVLRDGVGEKTVKWHINWVTQLARFVQGKPLHQCTAKDVNGFLNRLKDQNNVDTWQVEQARNALRLLYRDFLRVPWALKRSDSTSMNVKVDMIPTHGASGVLSHERLYDRGFRDDARPKGKEPRYEDLFKGLRTEIPTRHYSIRTEQAYEHWVRRFLDFHGMKPIEDLGADAIRIYLEYLAVERKVSASTQNQALNAFVFLFEQVLKKEIGTIGEFTRAKRPKRIPVVLAREEVNRLLGSLTGSYALMAGLLYGSGLRLMECVQLRVQHIDFAQNQIVVKWARTKK
jgi:hypothetical protein